jgi:hypothetical protein
VKTIAAIVVAAALLTGCTTEANTASYNLSKAAEQFEVDRRIVFFNGITDTYLMTIEGRCSIESDTLDGQLEVTCRVGEGEGEYKKHFLGLSDNVSYFVEQTEGVELDPYRYRVVFRPESILPDIDLVTGG